MNKDDAADLAYRIYEITKPMFDGVTASGGNTPDPDKREALIAYLIESVSERTESGRILLEVSDPEAEGVDDITVYFNVGTITRRPSFHA